MKKLLFILLAITVGFSCKNEDDRFDEVLAMAKADLDAYKAGTLGAKLQKASNGLEYIIHETGTGAAVNDGDLVPTHYLGMFEEDGEVFDNSFEGGGDAPIFRVGDLIAGFNQGMKLLKRGGKATLFIPWPLGYGEDGSGPIPPKSDLVFYIELE